MRRTRELYMQNTSVTLVMLGRSTWKRRYVDGEIAASLRNRLGSPPNGLLAVKLPSFVEGDRYPDRLNDNLRPPDTTLMDTTPVYARWIAYPNVAHFLQTAIEEAVQRRDSQRHLINNTRERSAYNRS